MNTLLFKLPLIPFSSQALQKPKTNTAFMVFTLANYGEQIRHCAVFGRTVQIQLSNVPGAVTSSEVTSSGGWQRRGQHTLKINF